jgi:hypothetical protein
MSLRLGYFQEFKGSDMVALSCEPDEVNALRALLSDAMAHGRAVAIHDLAQVSGRHPARLFVCPTAAALQPGRGDFVWRLSQSEFLDVDSKLEALEDSNVGHQYFTLPGTRATLMVSVGEYSDQWWQHDA